MNRNIGATDRTVRISLAVLCAILYAGEFVTGTFGVVLLVVAVVLGLTGILGFCGAYALFGINTCKIDTSRT